MPYQPWDQKIYENFCFAGAIGDCKSTQKTVNEIINKSVSNLMASNSSNCSSGTAVNLNFNISDLDAENINITGASQSANVRVNFSCLQSQGLSASDTATIKDQIKTELQQKQSGYVFQPTEQENINRSINDITTNINLSNVSNCVANTQINQNMVIERLKAKKDINITNPTQSLITEITSECVQNQSGVADKITQLQTQFETQATQEVEGLDIFATIAGIIAWMGTLWVTVIVVSLCCCCCICLASIGSSVYTATKSSPAPQIPQMSDGFDYDF